MKQDNSRFNLVKLAVEEERGYPYGGQRASRYAFDTDEVLMKADRMGFTRPEHRRLRHQVRVIGDFPLCIRTSDCVCCFLL